MSEAVALAVDWGTTSFRMWALGPDGEVLCERRAADGLMSAVSEGFEAVLERHAQAAGIGPDVPAMLCGMVGSRTGWMEVPYIDAPVALIDLGRHAARVGGVRRDTRILPGVAQRGSAPDVMRGEETKLLGLGREDGLVLMPGTHTKWVRLEGGRLTRFSTFMTGEIFAHLRGAPNSVLAQALPSSAEGPDTDTPAFAQAVRDGFEAPEGIANRLFGLRASWLLDDTPPARTLARLSGLLIGAELAGAAKLHGALDGCCLVGAGPGAEAYARALDAIGVARVAQVDADICVRNGLIRAARGVTLEDAGA